MREGCCGSERYGGGSAERSLWLAGGSQRWCPPSRRRWAEILAGRSPPRIAAGHLPTQRPLLAPGQAARELSSHLRMELGGPPKPPEQEPGLRTRGAAVCRALQGSVPPRLCPFADGPSGPGLCPAPDSGMGEGSLDTHPAPACFASTHSLSQNHRITESQNVRGWKGPLSII